MARSTQGSSRNAFRIQRSHREFAVKRIANVKSPPRVALDRAYILAMSMRRATRGTGGRVKASMTEILYD
jgi:hypothetical protein